MAARTLAILVITLLVCALAGPAAASVDLPRILSVEVTGNKKTRASTVRTIARVEVGDVWDPALAERAKIELESCGLFQEVAVTWEPAEGGAHLRLQVRDKHSWIIAPTFYFQPGNIGGGVGYGEANLFGTNKKLLLYGQYATADTLFFGTFLDPRFQGSEWYFRIDALARRERVTEWAVDDDGENHPVRESTYLYLNGGVLLGRNLAPNVGFDVRVRGGWAEFSDPEWVGEDPPAEPPPTPQDPGFDSSTELRLLLDKRAHWNGVTRGVLFSLSHERSLPWSEFDYSLFFGKTQLAARFLGHHNLVHKGWFGFGNHLSFSQEFPSGGTDPAGSSLRGLTARELRGDLKLSSTFEYSWQIAWLWSRFAFRGLAFWDATYSGLVASEGSPRRYVPGTDSEDARWWNGVGAGFRIYVKTVVIPLVGVDVGYGLESGDWNVYLALGLTEL